MNLVIDRPIQGDLVAGWDDYALLDSGHFQKLERFGKYTLIRPEPQAIWSPAWSPADWAKKADARYVRDDRKESREKTGERGGWHAAGLPEAWDMKVPASQGPLTIRLAQTSFGHIGIFPEQMANWQWIASEVDKRKGEACEVLNLFAYTGVASLVARQAGAGVTHVDSVRQTVNWSNQNMEKSGLADIRWVVEDALKFVQREVRRGKTYTGILLDPPAYGRGPKGEKWLLEEHLPAMLEACFALLEPGGFLLLNLYSVGFSSQVISNLLMPLKGGTRQFGELILRSETGQVLPLGTFGRWSAR